jgi:CobQ-like glutamine amidotransferase family enzyme
MTYGDNSSEAFVNVDRGIGINKSSKLEGFHRNNFYGTHIIGPILPLNPLFCEYLISLAGELSTAAFKNEAMDAYNQRVKEFSDPNIRFE